MEQGNPLRKIRSVGRCSSKNLIKNKQVTDGLDVIQYTSKRWSEENVDLQRRVSLSMKKHLAWGEHNLKVKNGRYMLCEFIETTEG